jgi:hypothetical protein
MTKNTKGSQTTNSKVNEVKKPRVLTETTLSKKGKVIITEQLQNQIDYFHQEIGEVEWSGVLLYKIIEGSILEPEKLVVEAYDMYLMDIGSATYTEFDLEFDDIKDIHEMYPDSNPVNMKDNIENLLRKGMIHTHHSMNAYFSGTDMGELHDNAPNNDLYLSLIVNFDGEYCAKLCFITETTGEHKVIGRDEVFDITDKKRLCMIDLEIIGEEVEPAEYVVNRLKEVKAANVKSSVGTGYQGWSNLHTNGVRIDDSVITEVETFNFIQRLFKATVDPNLSVVYSSRTEKENAIGASLKACNKIYKKASKTQQETCMENIIEAIPEIVNNVRAMQDIFSIELVFNYTIEAINVFDKYFVKARKLGNQTFLKDLMKALNDADVVDFAQQVRDIRFMEEDEMDAYTYGYGYNGYTYAD